MKEVDEPNVALGEFYDNLTWLFNATKDISVLMNGMVTENNDEGQLAETAVLLKDIKDLLNTMTFDYHQVMIDQMKTTVDPIDAGGGNSVEIRTGRDRKAWDHNGLLSVVSGRIRDSATDLDTGEVTMTTEDMIKELMVYAHVDYWKVKTCSTIGINLDEYCTTSEGKTNVIVRRS